MSGRSKKRSASVEQDDTPAQHSVANDEIAAYLANFDNMPPEKQEKHLLFIVNWAVTLIRGQTPP